MSTFMCEVWVPYPGRMVGGSTCGRPAKGHRSDGKPACGIHLAAERRKQKSDEEFRAATNESQANYDRANRLCDQLAVHLIRAEPYYRSARAFKDSGYTGGVSIRHPEDAERLVKLLEGERETT